jgi:LysR family transcriptional regulator, nitrogen assimilation regulatory protein
LILPSPEHELRKIIEQAFIRSETVPHVRYEIDSLQVVRSVLRAGMAPALLTSGLWASLAAELDCIDFPTNPVISTVNSLCVAEGLPLSEAAQLIHALVQEVTRDIIVTRVWTGVEPHDTTP